MAVFGSTWAGAWDELGTVKLSPTTLHDTTMKSLLYFLVTIDLPSIIPPHQRLRKSFSADALCIATRVQNCWQSSCGSHELGKYVSNTILRKPQKNKLIDDILWRIGNQSQVTIYTWYKYYSATDCLLLLMITCERDWESDHSCNRPCLTLLH